MLYDIELDFNKTQKHMLSTNVDWYLNLASGTYHKDGLSMAVVRNYMRALTIAELLGDEELFTSVRSNPLYNIIKGAINNDNQ